MHGRRCRRNFAPATSRSEDNGPGIIVVVGTTGVGKTKLGVELAKRLGGEVINADVMQMYQGLSIATAKATPQEMDGVDHHLMSFLEPAEPFSPHAFRQLADAKIEEIHARGNVPIIVGGTMYYVQGLLWDHLINPNNTEDTGKGSGVASATPGTNSSSTSKIDRRHAVHREVGDSGAKSVTQSRNRSSSSSSSESPLTSLWDELNVVDPDSAKRIHPNNLRKIQQSLNIFNTSGVRHSELIRQQHAQGGGVGGDLEALRYKNCGVIWLRAETDVLKARLDQRVDKMMRAGLAKEIADLQSDMLCKNQDTNGNAAPFDPSRGVFQSIGFKEFDRYLTLLRTPASSNTDTGGIHGAGSSSHSEAALEDALTLGVEQLKLSTRRYARRQLSWIRNRIVGNIPTYMFDATNVDEFDTSVVDPAVLSMRHSLGLDITSCEAARAKSAADNAKDAASTFVREYNEKVRAAEKKAGQRRKKRKLEAERRHARNCAAIAAKRKRETESGDK